MREVHDDACDSGLFADMCINCRTLALDEEAEQAAERGRE